MHVPWWTLFSKRLRDRSRARRLEDGRRELCRRAGTTCRSSCRSRSDKPPGPKLPFTTTVRFVYAQDGEFVYDDHVHAVERERAQPQRSSSCAPRTSRRTSAKRTFEERHRSDPEVPADARRLDDAVRARRRAGAAPAHRSRHRRRAVARERRLDFSNWPEQTYNVNSTHRFSADARDLLRERDVAAHRGGRVRRHLPLFKGGFTISPGSSRATGVARERLAFPDLHGALVWEPKRFVVTHADSKFLGGDLRFSYGMEPLGTPGGATATLDRRLRERRSPGAHAPSGDQLDVLEPRGPDAAAASRWRGRTAGSARPSRATGKPLLRPVRPGRHGDAAAVAAPDSRQARRRPEEPVRREPRRSADSIRARPTPGRFPLAAQTTVPLQRRVARFRARHGRDAGDVRVSSAVTRIGGHDPSCRSTSRATTGRRATGCLPRSWRSSASPTGAIEVGGRGTFDGEITGVVSARRASTAHFAGEHMRAWDVDLGPRRGRSRHRRRLHGHHERRRLPGADGATILDRRALLARLQAATSEEINAQGRARRTGRSTI